MAASRVKQLGHAAQVRESIDTLLRRWHRFGPVKIHLIGICGTGMGSLAGLLKAAGHDVRGADSDVHPPMSPQLAEPSSEVMNGYRPENLDWRPDQVVVGNIASKDHVEVKAAEARGLKLTSFPALLEEL